ncbi:MAG: hypothetical protein ACKODH_08010 [Limisphaerales bacterium]
MSDETTDKPSKTWLYVVGLLVGVPLCYVLSTGPVVVLAARGLIPGSSIEAVYKPLIRFMDKTGLGGR